MGAMKTSAVWKLPLLSPNPHSQPSVSICLGGLTHKPSALGRGGGGPSSGAA